MSAAATHAHSLRRPSAMGPGFRFSIASNEGAGYIDSDAVAR